MCFNKKHHEILPLLFEIHPHLPSVAARYNDYLICSSILQTQGSEIEIKVWKFQKKQNHWLTPSPPPSPKHKQWKIPGTPPPASYSLSPPPKSPENCMANPSQPITGSILWSRLLYWHSRLAVRTILQQPPPLLKSLLLNKGMAGLPRLVGSSGAAEIPVCVPVSATLGLEVEETARCWEGNAWICWWYSILCQICTEHG